MKLRRTSARALAVAVGVAATLACFLLAPKVEGSNWGYGSSCPLMFDQTFPTKLTLDWRGDEGIAGHLRATRLCIDVRLTAEPPPWLKVSRVIKIDRRGWVDVYLAYSADVNPAGLKGAGAFEYELRSGKDTKTIRLGVGQSGCPHAPDSKAVASPTRLSIDARGGSRDVEVSGTCDLSLSGGADWVSVGKPRRGAIGLVFSVFIEPNQDDLRPRSTTLTIGGESVTVEQLPCGPMLADCESIMPKQFPTAPVTVPQPGHRTGAGIRG
jgi:hypothetical protein